MHPIHLSALALCLLLAVASAVQADEFGRMPAELRFEARFQQGEPQADYGLGDLRLGRMMWGRDYSRVPWDGSGNRVSLPASIQPAPTELFGGDHLFELRTDAQFRMPGHFNPQAGSVGVWVRRSELFDRGGVLLTVQSTIAGGSRNAAHWVLGISEPDHPTIPAGRLYMATGQVHCIAEKPLPEGDWVHLAAVWDAESGVRLYANGDLIGNTWGRHDETGTALERAYPAQDVPDVLHRWTLGRPTGSTPGTTPGTTPDNRRQRIRLTDESPWEDITVTRQPPAPETSETPATWVIDSGTTDTLQLRAPEIRGLVEGTYRLRVRYRQELADEHRRGLNLRLGVRWPAGGRPLYTTRRGTVLSGDMWQVLEVHFDTPGAAHLATSSIDLNLPGPGRYEIAEVVIEKADPASSDLLPRHWTANDLLIQTIPAPVQRLRLYPQPEPGALTHLRFYDGPLTDQAIQALAEPGGDRDGSVTFELPTAPDLAWRKRLLGWDQPGTDWIPLAAAMPASLREAVVENAYEDLRLAGWLAVDGFHGSAFPWWYQGYNQLSQRRLHVVFTEPSQVNYLVTRGNLIGSLHAGGTPDEPEEADSLLAFTGTPLLGRMHLEETASYKSLTVVRNQGVMSHFHAYHVSNEPGQLPEGAIDYHLRSPVPAAVPLSEAKRAEMISSYRPEDRGYLVGHPEAGDQAEVRAIEPMRPIHLFTPAMSEDTPLDVLRLRLHTRGLAAGSRLHVRVHDSFDLWRERGRFDFQLQEQTAGDAPLDITLNLRPTLILQGDAVWVTLYFESAGELLYEPGRAASRLTLYPADRQTAERHFLEWELAGWRHDFTSISEARPWGARGGISSPEDGWWLQIASPNYEQMVRTGQALLARWPEEPRVRAWFQFIHPGMPNPAADLPLPETEGHPRWAELARANLKLYHRFAHWWSDQRAHPNGELGSGYNDDTDLMQDWPDIALIHDPDGQLRQTVLRLTDSIWNDYVHRGRPVIVDGLNSRWTDALHAYEDGLNVAPMAFLLDYGNPVAFERLMATAARYDGYLLKRIDDQQVRFNSEGRGRPFWDSEQGARGDAHHNYWFLVTHPGLTMLWYNGHPTVRDLFTDLATWKLDTWRAEHAGGGPTTFFTGMYLATRDARYLPMLFDQAAWDNQGILQPAPRTAGSFDASLLRRLDPAGYDKARTLATSRENAANRFNRLGTTSMGFAERRHERNWMEWQLSGEKQYLEEGLAALYRRLRFTLPALTVAEQSADRVSPPKQLISQMYLGGVAASRNHHFHPNFAVSYDGLSLDFAALVAETTPERLRVVFYNFESQAQHGGLRVWHLAPGRYQVRFGLDTTGDDRIDRELSVEEVTLTRASRLPLSLPSEQLAVLEITQIEPDPLPLHERADLAISEQGVRWEPDGTLVVRVHNIGVAAAVDFEVRLSTTTGQVLASHRVARLDAPLDLKPKTVDVRFDPDTFNATQPLVIEVDPDAAIPQIYRGNLRLEIRRRSTGL